MAHSSHVWCGPCRYNTLFLSQMFRIRQQRVMAILALKEIELVRGLQHAFALHHIMTKHRATQKVWEIASCAGSTLHAAAAHQVG